MADVGEELAFRRGGGVGGFLGGRLGSALMACKVARALVDAVLQFPQLLQHGPAFPELLFGSVVFGQLLELGRPADTAAAPGKFQ